MRYRPDHPRSLLSAAPIDARLAAVARLRWALEAFDGPLSRRVEELVEDATPADPRLSVGMTALAELGWLTSPRPARHISRGRVRGSTRCRHGGRRRGW